MRVLERAQDYKHITHDNLPGGTTCKELFFFFFFFFSCSDRKTSPPVPPPFSRGGAVPATAGLGHCAGTGWHGLHSTQQY